MSIFKNLFGKKNQTPKIECPRCLGKGHVDEADIIRLEKQLYWAPGACAYCKKTGKVVPSQISKVNVDAFYLTENLTNRQRNKIINNDKKTIAKAQKHKQHIDAYVTYIAMLYTEEKATVEEIVEILIKNKPYGIIVYSPENSKASKKEAYTKYVKKVIISKQL
ncbi:hypothetical protein [uncultured Dokdonia sp.]|uniref:hypothetical protein n=1 Tax=uncultured Dokdonia sp. TaxID=575653 RepID=UPI002632F8F2|nr:hypothetical protein [uncultured Dokdonia sp.]